MSMFKVFPILILSTSLALAGCKKKEEAAAAGGAAKPTESAPAKPADPAAAAPAPAAPAGGGAIASDDDYIAKGTAMNEKLMGIFKAAGTDTDCDKLADELTKFSADNAAMIAASKTYEAAHPDAKKKYDEATKDKTAAFEAAATPALNACQNNKKLADAMTKLAD